jgi:hypothetical protein
MSLQIGRCTITNDDIEAWPLSGDRVRFGGALIGTDLAHFQALRQQIIGLGDDQDEPIVPVIWTEDPAVNGFYRILNTTVELRQAALVSFWGRYQVELERVGGWAAPMHEVNLLGDDRFNNIGVATGGDAWIAVPGTVTEFYDGRTTPALFGNQMAARTTATGPVNFWWSLTNLTTPINDVIRYVMPPADNYVGAATLEFGAGNYPLVGRQVPATFTPWRMSNGLVRVTPSATAGAIDVAHYDGTGWDTAKTYRFYSGNTYGASAQQFLTSIIGVTVLRNDPAAVTLRLALSFTDVAPFGGPDNWQTAVTLTLRRGSRYVEGGWSFAPSPGNLLWVGRATNEAATRVSKQLLRATSNDASGNRFVLMAAHADNTATYMDVTVGAIGSSQFTAAPVVSFAIGSEIGGTGAADPDRATDLLDQYRYAQSDRLVVVTR